MRFQIHRRNSHYVFGVIQSGLTCLIAAGIASFPAPGILWFFEHWMIAWLVSWAAMLPVVILAAPVIRAIVHRVTVEHAGGHAGHSGGNTAD